MKIIESLHFNHKAVIVLSFSCLLGIGCQENGGAFENIRQEKQFIRIFSRYWRLDSLGTNKFRCFALDNEILWEKAFLGKSSKLLIRCFGKPIVIDTVISPDKSTTTLLYRHFGYLLPRYTEPGPFQFYYGWDIIFYINPITGKVRSCKRIETLRSD